ncbi:MAG TPA: hypothetical protein VJP86_06285 [Vicinamibacterales bacterium]|jgi:hypothetical protein|nr:hypothetical protein [Vicinamibacterales bacterium]
MTSSRLFNFLASVLLVSLAWACSPKPDPPPPFELTATVKDLMDSVVDPNADGLWESVAVEATLQGVTRKQPETDDDWKALRRHAIAIIEVSNSLIIPGRRIAQPHEKAENDKIDLTPEEIQAAKDRDPDAWIKFARGLHDAGVLNLKAVESRDLTKFMDAGEALDTACENCHKNYWYRDDPALYSSDPRKLGTESGK